MKELSVRQNIIWNTLGCLLYQGCQWLTTIFVVTLSSSYENSGILAFAMATGNIFSSLATYNTRAYQVSDVAHQFTQGNYVAFRLITTIAAIAICAVYSVVMSPGCGTLAVVLVYLLFKADEVFVSVLYGVDQIGNRMDYVGLSQGIRGIASLSVFCLTLILTGDLVCVALAMFLACGAVTFLYDIPHSNKITSIAPSITRDRCARLFIACAPAVAAMTLYGAISAIVRQWYGIQYGEDMLGIYAAIATPCVLVQAAASYMYNPLLTPLAKVWSEGDCATFVSLLRKTFSTGIVLVVSCLTVAALFGPDLLKIIYGDGIVDYAWMITPALIAASLMASTCFMTDMFIAMRHLKQAVMINAAAFAISLATMDFFVRTYAMNGVNIALIVPFAVATTLGITLLFAKLHQSEPQG